MLAQKSTEIIEMKADPEQIQGVCANQALYACG